MANKKLSEYLPARTPLADDLVPTLRSSEPNSSANDISTIADMILLGQVGTSNGIDLTFTNPTASADSTSRVAVNLDTTYDSTEVDPLYANQAGISNGLTALNGQQQYGGQTNAKTSFFNVYNNQNAAAAGQRFSEANVLRAYGMGDAFLQTQILTTAAGVGSDGDEGQGFWTASFQNSSTNFVTTISSVVTPATINTTTTQIIAASKTTQAVTVASTTGVSVGQWVVIDGASGNDIEAVKITAVGGGAITGVFRANHLSGVTVKPATVLTVGNGTGFGQKRPVVNLSASAYTTGTANPTSESTTVVGAATVWTASVVGGDASVPGYIAFTDDDNATFADTIKAWFRITAVTDTTHLSITRRDLLGEAGYPTNGLADGGSNYTIRPGAKLLMFDGSTETIVLETNTFTWTAGQSIECPQSVEADWSAILMRVAPYVPGHYRAGINLFQSGYFDIENAIKVESIGTGRFNTGIYLAGTGTGLYVENPTGPSLSVQTISNNGGAITWPYGGTGPSIGSNNFFGNNGNTLAISSRGDTLASATGADALLGVLSMYYDGSAYLRWNGSFNLNGTVMYGNATGIGIGKTVPDQRLNIYGSGSQYILVESSSANEAGMVYQNPSGLGAFGLAGATDQLINGSAAGDLLFTLRTGASIVFSADGAFTEHHLTIAETGTADFFSTVNATGYKAGGTAGVATFGPAVVTSITVKGGIITAIS